MFLFTPAEAAPADTAQAAQAAQEAMAAAEEVTAEQRLLTQAAAVAVGEATAAAQPEELALLALSLYGIRGHNMNYAIVENGIVTNIVVLSPGTSFPNAVPYDDIPVQIGDTYSDGKFYHDGVVLKSRLEDMMEALELLGVTE